MRRNFPTLMKRTYTADGIQLQVPYDMSESVITRRSGTGFITTIYTSQPLTPPEVSEVDRNLN